MNPTPRTRISHPAPRPVDGSQKPRYPRGCTSAFRAVVVSCRRGFGVQRFKSVAPFVAPNVAAFIVVKQLVNPIVQRCNVICTGSPYTGAHTAAHTRVNVRCTVAPLHYYTYLIEIYKYLSATVGATLAATCLKPLHFQRRSSPQNTNKSLKTIVYRGLLL